MSTEGICSQRVVSGPSNGRSHETDPADLRRFFRRHAAAVVVVTAVYDGLPVGLLVSSLASVSANPPLVSFNVALTSSSWPALRVAEEIGVHVLAADQDELADRFARKGADRFSAPTSWQPGLHGVPVIEGTAARSIARVEQRVPAGDHVIVVARLLQSDARDDAPPLVHHDGGYHRAVPTRRRPQSRVEPSRLTVVRSESVSPVVRAVPWDDPVARQLREEMASEAKARYADLFTDVPERLEDAVNDVDPASVVRTVVAEIPGPTPGAGVLAGHAALIRRGNGELEVKRVYVRRSHRRRGVSRVLLVALEDFARAQGAPRVVLATGPRQPEAAALYEAIGYDRGTPYGPPEWHDIALFFEKTL